MAKRKTEGPNAFWNPGMPFLAMLMETDAPDVIFQPMKAIAIGQLQASNLVNRRFQALAEFPHKVAACRSPNELMLEQMRFFQTALRDYSDAMQVMAKAWDHAIKEQTGEQAEAPKRHDYLALPGMEPAAEANKSDAPERSASKKADAA